MTAPTKEQAEQLARRFHEAYERLAPQFGYTTRPDTRDFDPASPNGRLMVAVCAEVIESTSDAELPVGEKVALDIAKWFVQGDRPDEWKLKEWAETLDRDAIGKAYEDLKVGSGERGE